jgi:DNA processing protein
MAQLRYWLWLSTLPGLTLRGQRNVLQHFGSPEEAYLSDETAAAQVDGLSGREQQALGQKDLGLADRVLEDCRRLGIGLMTYQDALYPQRLKNIDTPPMVLYYKGTVLPFDELPVVAVVGSRKASGYGLTVAKRMGYQLGASGGTVISGAARGIDSLALEGALSAGASVAAVLGNGLDIIYPPEAGRLYEDIQKNGCLLSEFPPGTPPYGRNFPQRNRILSGLSLGVLVVEASRRSGSLITANLALEQGRDVFAVPGNIGLEVCEGSNALIQEGAMLASCGWDILREYEALYPDKLHRRDGGKHLTLSPQDRSQDADALKPENGETDKKPEKQGGNVKNIPSSGENRIDNGQKRNYIDLQQIKSTLSPDEQAIVSVLEQGQRHVDDVIAETGLAPARVLSSLTLLEVKGYVTQQPGKRFDLNIN